VTAACDPTLVDAADVAAALRVDPERGLTQPEASRRLARDGLNELRAAPKPALWSRVVAQFRDPLVYLLLVAIVISGVAWVAEGAEAMPVEAIVIAAIVVAKAVLGFVQQARAEDAVAALAKLTAATSTVRRVAAWRRCRPRSWCAGTFSSCPKGTRSVPMLDCWRRAP